SLYNSKLEELYQKVAALHSKNSMTAPIVTETELRLTGQFFSYASKVFRGSDLDAAQLGWFIPRKKINISALLDSALKNKGEQAAFMVSANVQYQKLEKYLTQYQNLKRQHSPELVPPVKQSLHPGITDPRIRLVKQKLFLLGDLKESDTSAVFDTALVTATRNFQQRMGLAVDDIIGNNMIGELNVPIADRIKQLLINLERIRWMPIERASNFVLVNIPEYKLHVFDSGHQLFDMNVIVGSAANNTVIFSGKLSYVVFSPYWNLPSSIVRKEVLPAIRRNPNYLSRNHMEITGYSNGIPIIRQVPGPHNSLGLVKFLFPNNYNIYLHDTPNRNLFSETSRGFSHGCIRISEPKKFASYLLRNDSAWNDSTIDEAMHLAKEKWVSLQKPVTVYIVYFTAWVDADGRLNFRKDIYGHDKKMEAKLFAD
ncbi:MAG: L,D-transpeptidase family protein, partial [Bacteroidota bacterium]|nr:L,D-transpeptidase family protein [Bacteroidota bacterium]